ncbi:MULTISPECIES: ATP phosphoribosyltransferase regulatory subunit [unclassified Undibacterium]|uniref:ATP phosphoribosyltransferase regulatory subunit n=1 Tax=unclassified Undibacterium TaxID=2630295 RepID=UPI002AC9BD98|nr:MULTISPECIES: ATP phosphoribosyltransferase regulatory subunit [unclassified Undibacterium]MEB0138370.1 ATP phosphoribosyltransferase regulatory subunit [Undibacterium sp. CCC2.1]MEB0172747.1 ATP phosphoribosyltransferase regulatory subunit [Undibacterium sp. CCC1.1]MEB0174745.1 ATP phosphoribosyltransferase regulatory subunit [Undibacterium sp. CCC3.4]MEB0213942.1 ATP phosphoribosyltransferase regulatory subunit [Undibacterium sp. 5I2]WPX42665.1 ATP phosphoribosyltransferase regulatory sub
MPNWLLPENIADVLPSEARKIEDLRRVFLDHFRLYGYELVMPPMLEYIESLLTGTGQDMDLRTFKLVDQVSGRTMGLRADMTTQVARIDAHLLNRNSVTRLCYAGNVLHTKSSGLHATREPIQIGAEIYGHAGLEADAEIQELVLACLALAGISEVRIDLCHVAVLRAILELDPLAKTSENQLFSLLQSKDTPGIELISRSFSAPVRAALLALPGLYGDVSILERARLCLPTVPGVTAALDELGYLAGLLGPAQLTIDLADLRGYHYHSGVMFSVFVPGLPNAVARGGRYDHVGEAFGRARPATGFSLDLRELARLMPMAERRDAIRAPWSRDAALLEKISELRRAGEVVIQNFPGHENEQDEFDCNRTVAFDGDQWVLQMVAE